MITLKDAIQLMGYTKKDEQMALIKLMAYRDCFSKEEISEEELKSEPKTPQTLRKIRALACWAKSGLKAYDTTKHKGTLISDEEAFLLLKLPFFTNLRDACEFCLSTTQVNFLRESFDLEGLGLEKEKKGVNILRYNPIDELHIKDLEEKFDKRSNEYQIYQLAKTLKLIDEVRFPADKDIEYFIIHACVEKFAKDRVYFMESVFQKRNEKPSKPIKIYYTTNPRGLFNDEESLHMLLAEQFQSPEKASDIYTVLQRHKEAKDDKVWTRHLTSLKKEILSELNLTEWPESKTSFYYKNKEHYEMRAKLEGRESLKDWPCATDMIAYHLKNLSQKYPNVKYELIEIIGHGKNGKIANTEDLTQAWVDQVGKYIVPPEFLGFISDNSMHAIENQSQIARSIIYQLPGIEFICAGPGATRFSIATVLDMITKTLYATYPQILKKIEHAAEIKLSDVKAPSDKTIQKSLLKEFPSKVQKKQENLHLNNKSSHSTRKFRLSLCSSVLVGIGLFAAYKFLSKESSINTNRSLPALSK